MYDVFKFVESSAPTFQVRVNVLLNIEIVLTTLIERELYVQLMKIGDIGLFITLVPKVLY